MVQTSSNEKKMPQIVYKAPLTFPIRISILSVFAVSAVLSWYFSGFRAPLTKTLMFIYFTLQIVNSILDPEVCCIWYTRRDPEDETRKIKVVRPVIGFRSCETQIGFTGGYEVRYDGWRYERALIRI